MQLNHAEEQVMVGALHTACEKYRECANNIKESDLPSDAKARLVDTFNRQILDCKDLLEKLEG